MPGSRSVLHWFGDRAKAAIDREIGKRMDRAGRAAVDYAKSIVPVDTGNLRASIGYVYRQDTRTLMLYADAPYAGHVERGTVHTAAQPFLGPAAKEFGRVLGAMTTTTFG